jgi:hypothetical protein
MFSELIDQVQEASRRGTTATQDILAYTRATMRECVLLGFFNKDLVEDQLTSTTDGNYEWARPRLLRLMRTVYYPASGRWPEFIRPGRKQQDKMYYYYGGPTYYIFNGVGTGELINIAYYMYEPWLAYYASGARPAIYNADTDTWTYLLNGSYVSSLGSDALDEAARAKVTHWLLEDWNHVIREGTLAKVLNKSEDSRAKAVYASYQQMKAEIKKGEITESFDV